jgi:hypothetical protein
VTLECKQCQGVSPHQGRAAEIAARVAAVSEPPAPWWMSWRCDHCGQPNTIEAKRQPPAQVPLFGVQP